MSTLVSFTKSANDEATEGAIYAMPATPLQVRLWKLNEAAPDPAWNVAVRFRLSGGLDREKFEQALQWVARRHEVLRTSFTVHEGAVVQRIAANATLPLQWCDLESLDQATQEAEIARLSLEHARQVLALTSGPLLRAGMLRLSDTEHILVWNAHHSVCDGWSVGLLVSDLMACYGELLQGKEPAASNGLDYGDYAVWLDAQRKTPEYEAHRVYWKQQLQGLEVAPLPNAWHADAATTEDSTIQSILLPRSLTDAIATLAQRHHSTFFHTVLAAFGLLLRTQQSQADVALETPMSGRDQSELESVVGAFVNYLPLRFRVDEGMRFSDLLREVRDMVTNCFDHAQFRYEDMLADLEKEGNAAAAGVSLTPVAFICQQDFVRPITAGGVAMTAVPSVSPGALRPLTAFMVERADGWRLSCEVDNHLVSQQAGLRLLQDFQRLLDVVTAQAEDPTAAIAARAGLSPITTKADENAAAGFDGSVASQGGVVKMPATEFQRRFWRLDSLNPGGVAFHVRIRLQLKGQLDVDALARAIASVARRNEILRTTLREEGEEVWQVVHPELPIDYRFLVSDVQGPDGLRSEAQRRADHAIIDHEGEEGFSLANGPLFRARVLRLENDRHWLAITLSHSIVDGWATGIFLEQLQQAYEEEVGSRAAGKVSVVQFSAYANSERKLLRSAEKDRRLGWWRSYLDGVWTPLELPNDKDTSRTDSGDAPAGLVVELLDAETAAGAKRFARECQATVFAVFGGLFQALLSRYSGQSDILFLTPHANRTDNTETIMGPLADPICLTGHIGAGTTFRELVTRFGAESMDAMEQALPLNLVTPVIDMRVGRNYHPLNQITFFYQRAFVHDMRWKGLEIEALPDVPTVTGSEWQLGVVERKDGVYLEFLYDATLYSEATIQIVQRNFARLLREAVMAPDRPLSQLKLMTAEETEKYSSGASLLPVIERLLPRRQAMAASASAPAEREKIVPALKGAISESERDMMRIWRQVLKIEDLGVDSNFFDLGGHSLLLTKMQRILKRDYGVQLTAAQVFRGPTLKAMAAWFEQARSAAKLAAKLAAEQSSRPAEFDPRIIPLQQEGDGTPIFVISQSMIFRTLAGEMGTSQPVYALQMLDEEITSAAASYSYDDLINFYVRLIREVQPSGPYRLSGWCVSGWIAYGVARRLEEEGEEIELLMIIDVWAPGYWHYQPKIRRRLMLAVYKLKRFQTLLLRLKQSDASQPGSSTDRKANRLQTIAGNIKAWLRERKNPGQTPLEQEMQRRGEMLEKTATMAHWAGKVRGKILLFRSGEEPTGPLLAPEMGWPELIGRSAHVEVIPGGHREIFNLPGARMMAARARQVLGLDAVVETASDNVEKIAIQAENLRARGPQGER
ncbi:MAG TPA: condensation domain-containing protein [Acidobacteriaceae bacterium]|nr:condensation domain-containing protein [Acidobacteriaceae bacterium]